MASYNLWPSLSSQMCKQGGRRRGQGGTAANTQLQIPRRPVIPDFDGAYLGSHRRTRHHADADASRDHAADGVETTHLDAHIESAAETGGVVHHEGVDGAAGVQADKRFGQHVGKGELLARRQRVAWGDDDD